MVHNHLLSITRYDLQPLAQHNTPWFTTTRLESCCAILSQWVWFMVRYAEQLVVNHGVLYRPEWLWIIVWWLWIMLCYTESVGVNHCVVVVNHVVLYWARWLWIMLYYAESVVVNHLVLCWAEWLWITVCYAEPVVVNHSELCWASGYEPSFAMLIWVGVNHGTKHDSQPPDSV
jgi:hypothetical protein